MMFGRAAGSGVVDVVAVLVTVAVTVGSVVSVGVAVTVGSMVPVAVAVAVAVVPVGEGSGVVTDAENRSAQKPWLGPTAVA